MRLVKLSSIIKDVQSGFASGDDDGAGIVQIRMNNVTTDGSFLWTKIRRVPRPKNIARFSVETDDILFNATNSPELVGKSALFKSYSEPVTFSNHFIRLRFDAKFAHSPFVSFVLQDLWTKRVFSGLCKQWVNQATVSKEDLLALNIPFPALSEQRRIAVILDQAAKLRRKRALTLERVDRLAPALFAEMFGDPNINPKNLPVAPLRKLGRVSTGSTPPSGHDGMFGGNIPFVTPGDLGSNEKVRRNVTQKGAEAARTVRAGAALVCCIGATIGKMDKARHYSAFNQQINAVEWNDDIDDEYGFQALTFFKRNIASSGASTTLPILKKSLFENISIPIAPLDQQKLFARRIASAENLKFVQREQLMRLNDLFSSLTDRAFKGEL